MTSLLPSPPNPAQTVPHLDSRAVDAPSKTYPENGLMDLAQNLGSG